MTYNTDKWLINYHHADMHLSCPQCLTGYEIEGVPAHTTVVCHHCGIEFSISATQTQSPDLPEPASDNEGEITMAPPQRNKARIWTWLVAVLLLASAGGFWLQKEMWLDNRWIRSTTINFGIPILLRDKDWRIDADSVRAEWVTREGGSKVLVIRGRAKNLLSSELPPPAIEIKFFSRTESNRAIANKQLNITLPPSSKMIGRLPYSPPAIDTIPVAPLGEREFVFVIESLPEEAGDFTLTAHAEPLPAGN